MKMTGVFLEVLKVTRQGGWLAACLLGATAVAEPITILHAQQGPRGIQIAELRDDPGPRAEVAPPPPRPLRHTAERRALRLESEPGFGPGAVEDREYAWLGLATEEAPETLASHLKLGRGVGLVVTYLAPEGPAAKAGLKKNDVLIAFNDQPLVHPAQLRKLVRVSEIDEEVKIGYVREGERQVVEVKLGKGSGLSAVGEEREIRFFNPPMRELPLLGLQEQMHALKESLGELKFDERRVQDEVKRSLEAAKRAVEEAMRQAGRSREAEVHARALKELEHTEARAGRQPGSVVVRSSANDVRSVVRSDDSGTMVIISSPKPHLTVHDQEGNLVFDGPVSTQEEREKVPKEIWERAEPMLDEMGGLPEAADPAK